MATLTLDQFRNTKTVLLKDAQWCSEWEPGSTEQTIAEYDRGTFIFIDGEGDYRLIITNQEFHSSSLAELEEILYREWYLPEVADVPR